MMKILLINKTGDYEPYKKRQSNSQYPLGLAFIYNSIKKANLDVGVLDLNINLLSGEGLKQKASGYDILGFSTSIGNSLSHILKYIAELKTNNNIIIVGGTLATSEPERFIYETKTDVVVIGEGETTIVELIKTLQEHKDLQKVKGICFRNQDNKPQRTEPREKTNLEGCEADYSAFDVSAYFIEEKIKLGNRNTSMFTSRGCPYNCQFCSHPFGSVWRGVSAQRIINQINHLKKEYGVDGIQFWDDNFMHDKERVTDFLDLLEKEKLSIEWACSARVDNITGIELIKRMKKLGCKWIGIGVESGEQRTLNNMRKGITVKQIYNALDVLKKADMFYYVYIMIGMPYERLKDVFGTLKLINMVRKTNNIVLIGYFSPRPNSTWYNLAIEKGLKPLTLKEWAKYSKKSKQSINLSDMGDLTLKFCYLLAYALLLSNKRGLIRIKQHLHPKKVWRIITERKIF